MLTILNDQPYNIETQKQFVESWQVFDGVTWRHSFHDRETAKRLGKQFGGERIGLCTLKGDSIIHESVQLI